MARPALHGSVKALFGGSSLCENFRTLTAQTSSATFDPFAGPSIVATAPSTEPQRAIWTASALGDDPSLAFNESITVRLRGALDLETLELALGDLVQRHEALRMTLSGDGLTLLVGS